MDFSGFQLDSIEAGEEFGIMTPYTSRFLAAPRITNKNMAIPHFWIRTPLVS
jgi:hypothetical protein